MEEARDLFSPDRCPNADAQTASKTLIVGFGSWQSLRMSRRRHET